MATYIGPGQYRLSLGSETLTSSTSWSSLIGVSTNQTLKLMGLYYGTSGTIDMGGGSDTLIINVNARARLDLRNTEFVYAAEGKSVILQLMNTMGSSFTTDGTIKEITGAGSAKHRVTFEHGLANAGTRPNGNSVVTVSLGAGTQDVVNFEHSTRVVNLPGGGTYTQNAWVIYATPTGFAAYNNFRDYTVNVLGNVEQLTYNGDTYVPGSTNLLISNVAFSWVANAAATNFIVNVPSVNVYFRTGGANSFLDNNAVFVTSNNVGLAQEAVIAARAVAAEGVIRVEAGISIDDSTEYLFIGTTGNDTMAASTTNATVLYGFDGDDILSGNTGIDTMFGGMGEDTITGGAGDAVYGNEDEDLIIGFATGASVDGGSEIDTLQVNSSAAVAGLAAASNGALANVEIVTAAGAAAGVTINLGNQTEGFTIIGSGEIDTITVSQGVDTVTGGMRADTLSFGTAGSLVASMDTVNDYEDDVLDFGGDAVLVGAGGSAVAATSVATSANGKVTFAAADDTLAEKIAAIRADSRLDAANAVAVFSDGADSYVYYAGAAIGNTDDQIIKLTDQSSLDKLVIAGGNVTLDTEPPSSGLTTTLSLLPTITSWTGAPGGAAPTGFTPGNDGNANPAQGDGVNGNTNQLIRNAGGTFGTHVQGGDDTYGLVAVPAGLWSAGLNMFGTTYTNLYIGTNGYVTFGKGFSGYSPSGIAGFTRSPMIAAQYDDLYTDQGARNVTNDGGSGTSQNSHNMYYFIDGDKMVFTWDNVGLYSSASSTTAGNRGSAFQIIIHKPTGDAVADQNFGMEIRYEEVTQQSPGATAGWTAGDQVNYGLVNNSVVLSTVATSSSNVGTNGVWAWEVSGGVVSAPYFVPDIGIGAGGVDVANLSFRNAMPTGFTISGDGNGYGFEMTAAVANGVNSSAILNTIASPHWNLWKEQYKDEVATITVTPTGDANGAPVTMDINIFDNGLDTVTRVGGAAGTTLAVSSTSSDLNTASNSDISTITTVQATAAVSIDLSNQTEGFTIAGSAGADTLVGGQGNDAINGGLGNDSLTGGLGNDTFTVGMTGGTDTITDLGVGGDEISMSSGIISATLGASWTPTAATNKTSATVSVNVNGYNIDLSNIANTGGSGWTLTNSGTAASMTGGPLNDNITGGANNDTLVGGANNDTLAGGLGADTFTVTAGTDTISDLGNGVDILTVAVGATANSTLADDWTATAGTNNRGTASINAAGFNVDLSAADGTSANGWTITNGGAAATLAGSGQNDTVTGGTGADDIDGKGGDDSISGGAGADIFWVLDGTDSVNDLGNGADEVTIGGGATMNATLVGNWTPTAATNNFGTANVNVAGFNVDLSAAGGAWTVTNSAVTAVSITGSAGNDTITGNNGNDTITGGAGTDDLTGGAGNDTFRYATWGELSGETVNGGTHTTGDTIEFTSGISGENFHTAFGGVTNVERIQLFGANDINLGSSMLGTGITTILTGTGTTSIRNDDPAVTGITIDATAMADGVVLSLSDFGGATDFSVTNLRGDLNGAALSTGTLSATAAAGAGFAVSMTGGGTVDTFIGSQGADTLSGNGGNDTLTGGAGNDTLTGGAGTDSMNGGDGDDTFTIGTLSHISGLAETINGGNNNDTLTLGAAGSVNLQSATISNVETLQLHASNNTVLMTKNQHDGFTTIQAGGSSDQIELGGGGTLTGAAAIEAYTLSQGDNYDFTIGAIGQDVTHVGGVTGITVRTGLITSFAGTVLSLTDSNDQLVVTTNNTNLSAINSGAVTTAEGLNVTGLSNTSMTLAQHNGFNTSMITATGTEGITLTTSGTVTGLSAIETYTLAAGADNVFNTGAAQTVNANALTDGQVLTLHGSHTTSVTLVGGDLTSDSTGNITVTATTGSNLITTGIGDDFINGGGGNDTMEGGGGDDTIDGDTGNDVYVFSTITDGIDTIIFEDGADTISFTGAFKTAIDDIGAPNDTLAWFVTDFNSNLSEVVDLSVAEAIFVTKEDAAAVTGVDMLDTSLVAAGLNGVGGITLSNNVGQNALIIIKDYFNVSHDVIYLYQDVNGDAFIDAAELTVVGVVYSAFGTSNTDYSLL